MITTALPIILHAYETWSVTLREEYVLRVFKNNRELGKIFEPSKEEVKGDWRKLHI
jgi:glycyl-tRNA synthetase alpha subunit